MSEAKKWFELWWSVHGDGKNEELAWNAFKAGVKVAEIHEEEEKCKS